MPDYIEWYLVEIERVGRGALKSEDVAELQEEVRAHLTESSAAFVSEGLSQEDAVSKAIAAMGKVYDLVDRNPKKRWTIFWLTLSLIPLFVLAAEFSENGIPAEYGFYTIYLVMLLMVVSSYRARKVQVLPLLLVPVVAFVIAALFYPAWFIDLGELDGHGIVSRYSEGSGRYAGMNLVDHEYTYWQQFRTFLPTAMLASAWLFGIAGFCHLLGVYARRFVDWRRSRRTRLSFL